MSTTSRRLLGEFLGTALLLFVIVGSGIAANRLSDDGGIELLMHAIAVGVGLAAIIAFLAPVSGAHFNPAVTVGFWLTRAITPLMAIAYVIAQVTGAISGVIVANFVFREVLIASSAIVRGGRRLAISEFVVTFVLVLLVLGLVLGTRAGAFRPWEHCRGRRWGVGGGDRPGKSVNRVRKPGRNHRTRPHRYLHPDCARVDILACCCTAVGWSSGCRRGLRLVSEHDGGSRQRRWSH